MDPEHIFLRVHARVSGTLSQLLGLRVRLMLEYACLAAAGALFCLLVIMHTNFVQQIKVVVFGLRVRLKRRFPRVRK
ncbi:hypothetical protein BHE74_00046299 [Ensete ventricosum]|nr:hypothetical protein BHE74_00046299 [Ensete ventricosum]